MFRNMAAPETSGVAQRPTVQVPEVINPTEGCGNVPVSRSQSSSTDQVGDWYRLFSTILGDEYLDQEVAQLAAAHGGGGI